MKAAILNGYNKNGCEIEVRDIPVPEISPDEVLVKIRTAGVNPLDNMIIKGEVKLIVPYKFPLVMGNEFCGIIEKTGANVNGFEVGDRVYARMPLAKIGAFAEYTAIDYRAIAKVPEYLSDEEAAAVPLTALTALQSYELMGLKQGDKLFISGGTGSVGAMAIPIAKSLGATVYTNGSADNEKRVLSLGVDRFIDYKKEDYADILSDVDCVLDTLGERELAKELTVLKQGGSIVSLRAMPKADCSEAGRQYCFAPCDAKRRICKALGYVCGQAVCFQNGRQQVRQNGGGKGTNILFHFRSRGRRGTSQGIGDIYRKADTRIC